GGGGGRIALHYQTLQKSERTVVSAVGGPTSGWPSNMLHGSAGTIYWNDRSNQRIELVIDNSGIDKSRAATTLLDLGESGELAAKL
ncbi:hypothetical protein, partial [Escherichia coli]|uniref:hypothetical protein n=1 Tax=Escherichia coli TaxID=562 RepID=UPI0014123E55